MHLLALLFAFAIERLVHLPKSAHASVIYRGWLGWAHRQSFMRQWRQQDWGRSLLALLPALLIALVVFILGHGLLTFALSVVLLLATMASQPTRQRYRQHLQAASRGTLAEHASHQLAEDYAWHHFTHYAAPVVMFVLFGVTGLAVFVCAREYALRYGKRAGHARAGDWWPHVWHIILWLPVRIAGFGLLLVGHFSRGLPVWLGLWSHPTTPASQAWQRMITATVAVGEEIDEADEQRLQQLKQPIELLKRNILLMLAVVALLTLTGWFR